MTYLPTVLDPDQLNDLIDLRNQIARASPGFYVTAQRANRAHAPRLADLCYQTADLLTQAKVRADQAILAAASERITHARP